jgi:hypothetical protein
MTTEREALAMVYVLHKFHHYLSGNKSCGPYGVVIHGPKTPNFKENNKVATSLFGVRFFNYL